MTIAEFLESSTDMSLLTRDEWFGLMPLLRYENFEIYRDGSSRFREDR